MADTQLIKDKLDIVDVIGEYVELKRAGQSMKGRCPFHNEKTPSFMVNSERQSWHCFGCNKGGDIFSFIQEIEGMEFVEALKYLANRAGVQLTDFKTDVYSSQKNRLKDIMKEAARFYHNILLKLPAAKAAREYISQRGLTEQTLIEWQIGFIPDQWDLLTQYLLKKGFSIDDLVASGLTIKKEQANAQTYKGFYDRFRGRIMFPIQDIHGQVVGFTGRVLVETEHSGGKYVNTPQTLLYDKSRIVFALDKAKQEIKKQDLIVMVEGQMDVISSHQAGMKNVIATSGTAMTEEQIRLLKRYSKNINIAFDADAAGQAAAKRGIDIALKEGMNVKVIRLPEGAGKDPDEAIKKNKEVWFDSVKNARDIMEWYFERALKNKNLQNPKDKQQTANELLPEIALLPYAVEQDHWLRELANHLHVEVEILREDIKKGQKTSRESSYHGANQPQPRVQPPVVETRHELLLEQLFALIVRFPEKLANLLVSLEEKYLSTSRYFPLYQELKIRYTNNNSIHSEDIRELSTSSTFSSLIDVLLLYGEKEFFAISTGEEQTLAQSLKEQLYFEWKKDERTRLMQEIEGAEKQGDRTRLEQLLTEFQKI